MSDLLNRTSRMAHQILEDRKRHEGRQRKRRDPLPGEECDPFYTVWSTVVAGVDAGYVPRVHMRKGAVGFYVACRCCGTEFESKGLAYCMRCIELPADERRTIKPTVQGRLCQAPGCETFIPRKARADTRFCSSACRQRAQRADVTANARRLSD